jgi:hypothetical protein
LGVSITMFVVEAVLAALCFWVANSVFVNSAPKQIKA